MKVKFLPQNVEYEIKPGESVLHVAQDHDIHIKSVCRGIPSCAECRVRVVDGEYNVVPPAANELALIGTAWFVDRRRLSCQLRCFGSITVDLAEQVERESAGKKPRGRYNKDEMQESRAVLGNLVMSDVEEGRSDILREDDSPRSSQASASAGTGRAMSAAHDDADRGIDGDDDSDHDEDDSVDSTEVTPRRDGSPAGPSGKKRRRRRGRRGKGRREGSPG